MAGNRQRMSNALNCIQNFFHADNDELIYALFYRFLIGRRYLAIDSEWQALDSILSNVFSICVQNFSRITMSTLIDLKIQL